MIKIKDKLLATILVVLFIIILLSIFNIILIYNNPKQIIINKPVKSKYLTRYKINKKVRELIETNQGQLVYEWYDKYTGNRIITIAIINAALCYETPIHIQFSLAQNESAFNPRAICYNKNKSGEIWSLDVGLFQLNTYVYSDYSIAELMVVDFNSALSAAHLRKDFNKYHNWPRAIQAYNRGDIIDQTGLDYYNKIINYERFLDEDFNNNFIEMGDAL